MVSLSYYKAYEKNRKTILRKKGHTINLVDWNLIKKNKKTINFHLIQLLMKIFTEYESINKSFIFYVSMAKYKVVLQYIETKNIKYKVTKN